VSIPERARSQFTIASSPTMRNDFHSMGVFGPNGRSMSTGSECARIAVSGCHDGYPVKNLTARLLLRWLIAIPASLTRGRGLRPGHALLAAMLAALILLAFQIVLFRHRQSFAHV